MIFVRLLLISIAGWLVAACGAAPPAPATDQTPKAEIAAPAAPQALAAARWIMIGDSLTAGFGLPREQALPVLIEDLLRARGIDAQIVNAGVSGDTSAGGLARLEWTLSNEPYAGVIVALGANDMLQGLDPAFTRTNLRQMLEAIAARKLRIILIGMRASPSLGAARAAAFDAIYPDLAAEFAAPLYPFLLEGVALDPAFNQADGVHPNADGAKIIAARLADFLAAQALVPAQN